MPRRRDEPALYVALSLRQVPKAHLRNLNSKNTLEKDAAIDAIAEVVSSALQRQFEMTFKDVRDDSRGSMAGMTRKDLGWRDDSEA